MEGTETIKEIFGDPISVYTRADAIADGALIDVTDHARKDGFRMPVALTSEAFSAAVCAGGEWVNEGEGAVLRLPGGQDVPGRLHDIFWMLSLAIRGLFGADRVDFRVLVDTLGNGRPHSVPLKALCGPGDDGEPVITIMLPTED